LYRPNQDKTARGPPPGSQNGTEKTSSGASENRQRRKKQKKLALGEPAPKGRAEDTLPGTKLIKEYPTGLSFISVEGAPESTKRAEEAIAMAKAGTSSDLSCRLLLSGGRTP